MADLLTIESTTIPPYLEVHDSKGPLPGIQDITIVQNATSPPKAVLCISLGGVNADIHADKCTGELDSDTVKVLRRLPPTVLRNLAASILKLVDSAETTSTLRSL